MSITTVGRHGERPGIETIARDAKRIRVSRAGQNDQGKTDLGKMSRQQNEQERNDRGANDRGKMIGAGRQSGKRDEGLT